MNREPAIGPQYLRIYPATIRACQEGHHVRDILGLAEPLQRRELRQFRDLLLRLPGEEQLGADRSRCDSINRNVPASQLVREHMDQALTPAFEAI